MRLKVYQLVQAEKRRLELKKQMDRRVKKSEERNLNFIKEIQDEIKQIFSPTSDFLNMSPEKQSP